MTSIERPNNQKSKGGVFLSFNALDEDCVSATLNFCTKASSDKRFFKKDLELGSTTVHLQTPEVTLNETYLFSLVQLLSDGNSLTSNTLEVIFVSDTPSQVVIQSSVSMDNALQLNLVYGSKNGSVIKSIVFLLSDGDNIFSISKQVFSNNPLSSYVLDQNDNIFVRNYVSYEIVSYLTSDRGQSTYSAGIEVSASDYPNSPSMLDNAVGNSYPGVICLDGAAQINWVHPTDLPSWRTETSSIVVQHKLVTGSVWIEKHIPVSDTNAIPQQTTLTNLLNGSNYEVRLAYINSLGYNSHTSFSLIKTFMPYKAPDAIVVNKIETSDISNGQITVSWQPYPIIASLNGMVFAYYMIFFNGSQKAVKNNMGDNTATISGLDNSVSYEIKVHSLGHRPESGDNFFSPVSNVFFRKPFTSSEAVENLQATGIHSTITKSTGASLYVSWSSPSDTGGWAISKYKIEVAGATYFNTGQLYYLISDSLTNGTNYSVKVTPITKNLQSSDVNGELTYQEILGYSNIFAGAVPMRIADPLSVVSTAESHASVSLQFAPGDSNGGAPLASSNYECSIFNNQHVLVQKRNISPADTGLFANSFTGLTNGLMYSVEIRVQNSVGFSPIVNTFLTPYKELEFSTEPTLSGKTISFAISPNGRPISSYHVVGIDDDGVNSSVEEIHLYRPLTSLTQIGSLPFSETLDLSGDIAKYLVIVNSSTGSVAFRSNFTT
jgi:hypothetical protein